MIEEWTESLIATCKVQNAHTEDAKLAIVKLIYCQRGNIVFSDTVTLEWHQHFFANMAVRMVSSYSEVVVKRQIRTILLRKNNSINTEKQDSVHVNEYKQ